MIEKLPQSSGRFLGYKVSGKIRSDEEHLWITGIEAALEMHAKVCVLLVLDDGAGWGVKAGFEDIQWALEHSTKFDKIAIVSDERVWKWLVSLDSVFAKCIGIKERHFASDDLEKAWAWLKSEDAKKATA